MNDVHSISKLQPPIPWNWRSLPECVEQIPYSSLLTLLTFLTVQPPKKLTSNLTTVSILPSLPSQYDEDGVHSTIVFFHLRTSSHSLLGK